MSTDVRCPHIPGPPCSEHVCKTGKIRFDMGDPGVEKLFIRDEEESF